VKKPTETNWINRLLWLIYILLLLVLLPHTAWMFGQAEPESTGLVPWGLITAWAAATVFELVIAAMTHKLSGHITATPRYADSWKRVRARYLNAYGAGLGLAWLVSTYANLAHAVEFGQPIRIFAVWGWPTWTYSVAFGAILPTASLLFAWVLSSVIEADASEGETNPELEQAKKTIGEVRAKLREAEAKLIETEQRARQAEIRFNAIGDFFSAMMTQPKKERILVIAQQRPKLSQSAIAILTEASPAYVSEVLSEVIVNSD